MTELLIKCKICNTFFISVRDFVSHITNYHGLLPEDAKLNYEIIYINHGEKKCVKYVEEDMLKYLDK